MKKIFDIIFGFIIATSFTIILFPSGSFIFDNFRYWFGITFGLGMAYCIGAWNREEINKLKEEINKLKENANRK